MLFGVNLFFKLIVARQVKMGTNLPVLQKSLLGWIVVGEYTPSSQSCLMSVDQSNEVDELTSHVQKFWDCEEISRPTERTCTFAILRFGFQD